MAPAVREKMSKRPANRVEKPAIWQDVMVEVKETFRRIGQVKHSGFTLWDDHRMRTGPTLSRNRMARVKTQAPLRSFNLPPRTLREIENNRSQPPIVSFNHLQNLLGMCRRINAQSSLTERRKNPHDPSLYPVFIRRPVGTSARPLTPNSATPAPARRLNPPGSSAVPNRPSSAGNDRRHRPSTPSSLGASRPFTPPYSARKRPHTARPAMDDPPYAYAPPRFTLLLDISNRPAALGPPPPFTTRPSSASNTPRPGSSRSQKDDTSLKHPDEQQQQPASPNKKPRPPVPALKKIPADRAPPKLASDRTFDRTSQQSGSVWSFGPMAAAYFERRPLSAGDRRPQSAGDVHSERPPSRRRAVAAPANRPKPVLESSARSAVSTDLSVPDSSASSSVLPDRLSPSSNSSGRSSVSSSTTGPDTAGSEEATPKKGKGHNTDLWSPRGRPASPSDQRPPSRRGAKPTRKKKKVISASESTITTTTTEPSTLEASDENASGKNSGVSTGRGRREDVKRPDPSRVRAPPPYKSRSVALDNTRFDAEIKTPRGRPSQASSSISGGEAKGSPRRASNLSVPATRNLKPQEQTQTGPSSEEPSPGRPKVTFAAASASEQRKQWKESIDVKHSKQDQAMDRSNTPKQSKQGDQRAEAREDALQDRREGFFQRNLSLTSDKSRPGHDGHHTESILKSPRSSMKKEPQQDLVAVDIASEEEEDAETREFTDEDSIKTTTCIQSCSEISSEMSATEHEEEDDDDDEHRRPASGERQDARELEEVHQLQLPQQHDEKGEGEHHHHHHQQQQYDGEEGGVRENASDVLIKYSADAYVDFKNSMMNVIWNDHLESGPEDQLEKLFQSYIDINPPGYHAVLRKVIADVTAELKQAQRP